MRKAEEDAIVECQQQLAHKDDEETIIDNLDEQLDIMRETLSSMIDFSGNTIDEDVLERLVVQVSPMPNSRYKWVLNLLSNNENDSIICGVDGRKNAPSFVGENIFRLPSFQLCTGSDCT
ncbi:MAG: hypothetical protein J6C12_13450 [Lachnospiraceae bacterium]|nr:hypothetical protein [Lachnospiraceae bacterium]